MGLLSQKTPPRRITLHDHQERPAPPVTPPPPPPELFTVAPAQAPPTDWVTSQPWRKRAPEGYAPVRVPCAYRDHSGALYIGTPPAYTTVTVYTSVEAYNSRSEVPRIAPPTEMPHDVEPVVIDLCTLQVVTHKAGVSNWRR